jgi:hypothetical protein
MRRAVPSDPGAGHAVALPGLTGAGTTALGSAGKQAGRLGRSRAVGWEKAVAGPWSEPARGARAAPGRAPGRRGSLYGVTPASVRFFARYPVPRAAGRGPSAIALTDRRLARCCAAQP